MADPIADPEPIRFRTSKKRKAYRQRADDTHIPNHETTAAIINNNTISAPAPIPSAPRSFGQDDPDDNDDDNGPPAPAPDADDAEDAEHSAAAAAAAAAALRLRNSRRPARLRGMGMGFKSDALAQSRGDTPSQALVPRDSEGAAHDVDAAAAIANGVDSRFMHQTGLLTILDDVHMNEFIEARLASRARQAAPQNPSKPHPHSHSPSSPADDDDSDHNHNHNHNPHHGSAAARPAHAGIHSRAKDHQPARHGKLFEVAIPDDVRKDRDGKDGKDKDKDRERDKDAAKRRRLHEPWDKDKERRRPGRTSDDMERDAMVEQFLHENRLDVYDVAEPSSSSSSSRFAPGKDFSADARLAEQFRRQYYEDLALRRKKRRPALTKEQQQQRAAQASEVLKGPKLGGSRNQRAAIRNILLQQQGEKKA